MKAILPPLFRIDLKENGNTVQQLHFPSWSGDAAVLPHEKNRIRGLVVNPDKGMPSVLVIMNSAQPCDEFTHILRLRSNNPHEASAALIDFSEAKWIKHPDAQSPVNQLDEHARIVAETRDSWLGAFTHKRENSERGIEGLRPPQIGAIYAVQSHWTVNTDVAGPLGSAPLFPVGFHALK